MVKQNFLTKMLLLCALIVGSVSASWADDVVETIDFTTGSPSVSGYGNTSTWGNWTVVGGANNGGQWAYLRIGGGKNNNSPSTITGTEKLTQAVDYIEIVHLGRSNSAFSITSIVVETSSSTDFSNPISTTTVSNPDISSAGTILITPSSQIAANSYYKITINWTSGSGNMGLNTEAIKFYKKESAGNTWSVTYNGNGNTSGSVPTDNTEYNSTNNTVTVLGNTENLAKTGYTFSDWNTKADGTGTGYEAGDEFEISANTTLFAQWTVNSYNVTLPAADTYGTYTMNATNPVSYGTEVTLTYTPATGYEKYIATWSSNDVVINGNKFTMPDNAVTVAVSLEEVNTTDMVIDFEKTKDQYSDWTFSEITTQKTNSGVTAHGGSYMGDTNGKTSAYVQTNEKVNPVSLTCYVSKQSTNTTASIWYIQVSEDGTTWTNVANRSATDMNKGEWKEFTADLSSYSDVYVRVYYSGSTAIRNIDDLTLTVQDSGEPSIEADAVVNLTAEANSGEIAYTINNPDGSTLTASEKENVEWIDNVTVDSENNKVTFTTTANTGAERSAIITLTYGSVTKDVTINQARPAITYTLATSVVPGRHYIITSGTDGDVYAMSYDKGNNRNAVQITADEGTVTVTSADVYEFLIEVEEIGLFTIYDEISNGGYLYAASSSDNYLKTESTLDGNGKWAIEFDGDIASIVAQGTNTRNVMQYNSQNSLFACYATNSQSDVYLFERHDAQDFTVTITDAKYSTFSDNTARNFSNRGVTVYATKANGAGTSVTLTEVVDGVVPANTGVILYSDSPVTADIPTVETNKTTLENNEMVANVEKTLIKWEAGNNKYNYILAKKDGKVGFYKATADGAYLAANRAYLSTSTLSSQGGAPFLGFDDETTGIVNVNRETITNNQYYTLDGRRVENPTKGLYIVNGRKVIVK